MPMQTCEIWGKDQIQLKSSSRHRGCLSNDLFLMKSMTFNSDIILHSSISALKSTWRSIESQSVKFVRKWPRKQSLHQIYSPLRIGCCVATAFVACGWGFVSRMSPPAVGTVYKAFNQGDMGANAMPMVSMVLRAYTFTTFSVTSYTCWAATSSSYRAFLKQVEFCPSLCSLPVKLLCGPFGFNINSL